MTYRTFEGMIHFATAKAVLFEGVYWEGALWFPLSQVEIVPDEEMTVVVKVKPWLTRKMELDEFTHYGVEEVERMKET